MSFVTLRQTNGGVSGGVGVGLFVVVVVVVVVVGTGVALAPQERPGSDTQ